MVESSHSTLIRCLQIGSLLAIVVSVAAVFAAQIAYRPEFNYVGTYATASIAIIASVVTFFLPKELIERHRSQAKLLRETKQRLTQLEALHRISSIVAGPIDLEEALERILVAVRQARPFDSASLFVLDEKENHLRILASQDIPDEAVSTASFEVGEGIVGWAVAHNQPVLVGDCLKDARYKPSAYGEDRPRSLLAVPLNAGGKVVAALTLSHLTPNAFSEEDLRLIEMMASYASQIIENARLMDEVSEARALRRLDAMKTEFLAMVSHELRTPLTVIKGAVEILLEMLENDPDPVKHRLLINISQHQERLTRLVGDLLDMAQLEVGRVQLSRQRTNIGALIRETAASLDLIANGQNHAIEIDVPKQLPEVYVDRHRVQQVLTNLLGNAIQHTPEGVVVKVSVVETGESVAVSVADNGPGIPDTDLRHIFDKFSHRQLKSDKAGAGLGLAIAKSLVELHGGTMSVESTLGAGTTFTFTLPKGMVEE